MSDVRENSTKEVNEESHFMALQKISIKLVNNFYILDEISKILDLYEESLFSLLKN